MKKEIGQKIKEIREEKDMKQIAIHNNQSQISQIENGKISNPDEGTLKMIAKNLDISFEDLIEGTDWSPREKRKGQFAISPAAYDFKIDDNGYIKYKNSTFPRYNEDGDLNEFCPHSGVELIGNCKNCGREIQDSDYAFCMGCGTELAAKWEIPVHINRLITPDSLTDFGHCSANLEELMEINSGLVFWYNELKKCTNQEDWDNRTKGKVFRGSNRPPTIEEGKFEIGKKDQINAMIFEVQLIMEVEKKLRETLTHLKKTEETKTGSDKIHERIYSTMEDLIKENTATIQTAGTMTQVFTGDARDIYTENNRKLIEANEKSINMLADLLKSLDLDGDHSEIEQKLKSIKSEKKSETQNSDEKISEDGISETTAAEEAESKKKNAKENKKEDNNE